MNNKRANPNNWIRRIPVDELPLSKSLKSSLRIADFRVLGEIVDATPDEIQMRLRSLYVDAKGIQEIMDLRRMYNNNPTRLLMLIFENIRKNSSEVSDAKDSDCPTGKKKVNNMELDLRAVELDTTMKYKKIQTSDIPERSLGFGCHFASGIGIGMAELSDMNCIGERLASYEENDDVILLRKIGVLNN